MRLVYPYWWVISLCLLAYSIFTCDASAERTVSERIYADGDFGGDIRNAIFSRKSVDTHQGLLTNDAGGAVTIEGNFTGVVDNSIFFDNTSLYAGGAMVVRHDIRGDVKNSTFSGNASLSYRGGGIYVGGSFCGKDGGFSDIGGSKFLYNDGIHPMSSGGGIFIRSAAKLAAISGDVIFQGNINYAIIFTGLYASPTSQTAVGGRTIYFYDPIRMISDNFGFEMNPQDTHTGTILFDSVRSNLAFKESPGAKISYGTLALHNGASFGAVDNDGKFTLGEHATLRVAYGQEKREYILNKDKSFTEDDPSKIIKSYPPYDPNHVSYINAGNVNFDGTVHFVIPPNARNGDTLLRTSSWSSIWGATITLGSEDGQIALKKGDHLVLIRSTWLQGFQKNSTIKVGSLEFYLPSNSKELWAVLLNDPAQSAIPQGFSLTLNFNQGAPALPNEFSIPMSNPQNKAFSESYLAGIAQLGQTSDLIADLGMTDAAKSLSAAAESGKQWATFGAFSSGIHRCRTGSNADMRNLSLLIGLSRGIETPVAHLIFGCFTEYGDGSYKTHNDFESVPWVDGDGHSRHMGGGLLVQSNFQKHFYLEGSGRIGEIKNNWGTDDIRDDNGLRTSYRVSTPYQSIHGGGGYVYDSLHSAKVDVYGKCFWARRNGASIRLRTDDPIEFDPIESIRLRIGARYAKSRGNRFRPHAGIAWEHEFAGKAKAITYGMQIPPPSLGGNNCLGELGVSWKLGQSRPWTFNFDLHGSMGVQVGVKVNLAAGYAF
jgi:hypothetical protein